MYVRTFESIWNWEWDSKSTLLVKYIDTYKESESSSEKRPVYINTVQRMLVDIQTYDAYKYNQS